MVGVAVGGKATTCSPFAHAAHVDWPGGVQPGGVQPGGVWPGGVWPGEVWPGIAT